MKIRRFKKIIKKIISFQNILQGILGAWLGSIILALSILGILGILCLYSVFFDEPEIENIWLFYYGAPITFYLLSLIFYHFGEEEGRKKQEKIDEAKRYVFNKANKYEKP